jgi:transposase
VLLAADGVPNRQIAPVVGMNEHTVAQWRRRFESERLTGLQDRKCPGRPLVYDHDLRLRIVAQVTQEPLDPASHWSHSQLAKALCDIGISASQIGRILADLDIKPHRVHSWITRPDDPTFWERAADICGLYLVPPTNALVLSVDEKTGMPARSRTRPTTRPAPGRPARQEHEYARHGTAILLAALDVHGGGILQATDLDGNTAANFIASSTTWTPRSPPGWRSTWCWPTAPRTSTATPAGGSWPTPLPPALHSKPCLVAEPGGAVLLNPCPSAAQAGRVHLGRGPDSQGDGVHRRLQPHRQAVPLDLRWPAPQGQLIRQKLCGAVLAHMVKAVLDTRVQPGDLSMRSSLL